MAYYNDPYSNSGNGNRYGQNDQYQTDYNDNARYYNSSNQDYDATGPTYDPYTNNPPYTTGAGNNNVRFDDGQDDVVMKEERGGGAMDLARQRSTRSGSGGSLKSKNSLRVSVEPVRKHWNGFEHGEFTPVTRKGPRSRRGLKEYRYDARGNLWTKGSRARCFGRFFCCTLMIGVLIVVSVALSLALWIRPPAVTIGQVVPVNTTGSLGSEEGMSINLSVNIGIKNPNYFTADFSRIKAEIFYPINDTPMGGGESTNIKFPSNSNTNFTFPFAVTYRSADDKGGAVFADLGTRCGLGGGPRSNINVKYKITLGIRFLVITIAPVIQNTFTFQCPESLIGGALGRV